jgi:hypothetical protein
MLGANLTCATLACRLMSITKYVSFGCFSHFGIAKLQQFPTPDSGGQLSR